MPPNRNVLKKYAPQARLDFIQAMTNRAAQFGITKAGSATGDIQGELFILNGKAYPRSVATQRGRLIARIARDGFAQVMEAVAYTWFNRFLAIRYMELHHYFDHGCRVLSHPTGHDEPELLEKAATIALPGLDRNEIVELILEGTKDEQIYRKLLIAQCNDLHRSMPFLFEKIDDETELLLPENLLQSDSIIRKLVNDIAEAEWQEIEIIGWLYQFYISKKKDQVIGKVVKSEDIPAATQLFTPNWIVKYMVQNSLGAQWLATYPNSAIRAGMEYYVDPADQTEDVQAQIDAITPEQLDPEAITLIDPAVGSGHILVEAYDLFRAIYLERGYTKRETARAILTKNLFGLDIDDRAAQMAGFALLMKACADDRSVLSNPPKLNVSALQDSGGLNSAALAQALLPHEQFQMVPSDDLLPDTLLQPTLAARQLRSEEAIAIEALASLFDGAKTFGSLITVPDAVMKSLQSLDALLAKPPTGDLLRRQAQADAIEVLKPLVEQAKLLGSRYDCVVANPPYMGGKGMNGDLKAFVGKRYPNSKADLFAAFIERGFEFIRDFGRHSMVTMQSWMFLSSYEKLRERLLDSATLEAMAHMGNGVMGIAFGTAATNFRKAHFKDAKGVFCWVENDDVKNDKPSSWPPQNQRNLKAGPRQLFLASAIDFNNVPGGPIAYWLSEGLRSSFATLPSLSSVAKPRQGLATSDNDRFLRFWSEVDSTKLGIGMRDNEESKASKKKWFPCQKGGPFKKWYGNNNHVVNWESGGDEIIDLATKMYGSHTKRVANMQFYFREGGTWSTISSGVLSMRYSPEGFISETKGAMCFCDDRNLLYTIIAFSNSNLVNPLLQAISPTLDFHEGPVGKLPIAPEIDDMVFENCEKLINSSKVDWDYQETSWDFRVSPLLCKIGYRSSLKSTYSAIADYWLDTVKEVRRLEYVNNRLFIEAYGLQSEITPEVPLSEITLTCNPHYRYGGADAMREARLKSDTMRELVSYVIGCMMGRYSLAEPGLIYAQAGNVGFDTSRYGAFAADDDGIIPLTEEQWFADDAPTRIEEFLGLAWPDAPVMETLATLMDGLNMGKGGEPRSALRSYLSKQFYKDHLQTYKNRPIYWLFSSGKQKAFEALVYLHRYNEGTLARMRTNHVAPLMGKLQQRISDLDVEISTSSSSADKTRKARDKDKLAKQLIELRTFDEELRHLADQRIALDLDDGVKANYDKFGNLLAFKEKVCPKKKSEEE